MKKVAPSTVDAGTLRKGLFRRISRRTKSTGSINLPAVPALLDHHMGTLDAIFGALGRPFSTADRDKARGILAEKIQWAFERSHNSWVAVEWSTDPDPKLSLSYTMTGWQRTVAERYAEWVAEREPPLFGKHPDARVMDYARLLGPLGGVTCLDAGAGTGRNALPLARAGHVVDALEIAPALVDKLAEAAKEALLDLRVVQGSFFDRAAPLPRERYKLVVLAEMCSHWRGQRDLIDVFARLSELLEPGGVGLFNVFVAVPAYKPDPVARDFSQIVWCPVYTRHDIEQARAGMPLEPLTDESVVDYERAHMAPQDWPPTGWFERWCAGSDLFDLPVGKAPMELRWLAFKKT